MIQRLLPPYRLQRLARGLCDQYPDPPRPVSLGSVLGVYAPLLGYTAAISVIVVVAILLLGTRGGTSTIVPLLALLVVGAALIGGGLVRAVTGGLQRGVYATGEVVASSGMTARLRVSLKAQDTEVALRSRTSYPAGSRLDVMVDPTKGEVLLVLGPPKT